MQARLCLGRYDMRIRSATTQDAARLLAIYTYYVEKTAISFECDVPSLAEFTGRIAKTLLKYPYLVMEEDGVVQGYTYAGPFKERAAYNRSCELSIYLDCDVKGRGYGFVNLTLKPNRFLNMYACIADPITEDEYLTKNSEQFHQHLGFVKVGEFHRCACKFGRWYNMIWMEKFIGKHI